jgi:hypothetical protein
MSRIKVTYVAMDVDGYKPIMTAETFEDLRKGLDKYYAVDREVATCLGWTPHITKYIDEYEGYFKYSYKAIYSDKNGLEDEVDIVKVYCLNFYPETVIEDVDKLGNEDVSKLGYDEKGRPLTYWGGKQVPEMVEDDVEKLAEKYPYGGREGSKRLAFIDGYNTAKETLYTEEQVKEAIQLAREADSIDGTVDLDVVLSFPGADNSDLQIKWSEDEIIQSLKQPKQ